MDMESREYVQTKKLQPEEQFHANDELINTQVDSEMQHSFYISIQ